MKRLNIFVLVIVLLGLLSGGLVYYFSHGDKQTEVSTAREVSDYIRANISDLSPEKALLGGKFYVTDITINKPGEGLVSYEDGHVVFKAHFQYIIGPLGQVMIQSFKVITD